MDRKQIIMNFTVPPAAEELRVIAGEILESLPEELREFCEDLSVEIEEFPDEAVEQEQDLDDPYELLALYKNGKEISPGVERKVANDDDVLVLYRRPVLDLWCESEDDLSVTVRRVMIEEIGSQFDFSEQELEDLSERHFQGML